MKVDRILNDREERLRLRRENQTLRVENTYLREEAEARYGEMVGAAPPMEEVFRMVDRVAKSDSTVMIYGESGTGKELVARAIHARSDRADGPFVRVNCGALTESLLDSELFGHEKGAFTGAEKQRRGRFELAHGGTLFLDEISTIAPATQVRLLRVLQEREFERVGGEETIKVDVRIIVATNIPVDDLVPSHGFREDLFYRLHVVPLTIPPLRERMSDVPLLVQYFINKLNDRTRSTVRSVSMNAIVKLSSYHWPGNVRELENVIERALVLAGGEMLEPDDIPMPDGNGEAFTRIADGELPDTGMDLNDMVETMEEQMLRRALEKAQGVKAEAARLLGLKSSAFYYKLEKYGIEA